MSGSTTRRGGVLQQAARFAAIGSVLFGLDRAATALRADEREAPAVIVSAERVEALRRGWLAREGRPPTAAQTAAMIEAEIDDELLVQEARRLGYHRSDPVVRSRLARNMGFAREGEPASESELLAEALELGMDRTDLVVRRRLIQRLKLGVRAQVRASEPSERELEAAYERERDHFALPARTRVSHIYLGSDAHGDAAFREAKSLLVTLAAAGDGPERASELGDPFFHGNHLPPLSDAELRARFGSGFAASLAGTARGAWAGPVASSYGVHLVWLHERIPGRVPALPEVMTKVREAVFEVRARDAERTLLDALRRQHGLPALELATNRDAGARPVAEPR